MEFFLVLFSVFKVWLFQFSFCCLKKSIIYKLDNIRLKTWNFTHQHWSSDFFLDVKLTAVILLVRLKMVQRSSSLAATATFVTIHLPGKEVTPLCSCYEVASFCIRLLTFICAVRFFPHVSLRGLTPCWSLWCMLEELRVLALYFSALRSSWKIGSFYLKKVKIIKILITIAGKMDQSEMYMRVNSSDSVSSG